MVTMGFGNPSSGFSCICASFLRPNLLNGTQSSLPNAMDQGVLIHWIAVNHCLRTAAALYDSEDTLLIMSGVGVLLTASVSEVVHGRRFDDIARSSGMIEDARAVSVEQRLLML